jgi:uncharacterized alpha-E superfamily protein
VLARHAENLYWAGRHIERAEDTARMLDVTYHDLLEAPPIEARQAWLDLLAVLYLDTRYLEADGALTAAPITDFLVVDEANPGSILAAVARARDNARTVREIISTELWEAINSFYLELRSRNLRAELDSNPYHLYQMVKNRCQTISGVATSTMVRDDGWRFLMLGWMIERAEMMCRLLNVRYTLLNAPAALPDFHHWVGVLKSASALEAYRMHTRGAFTPAGVLEFLLLSRHFPRSVLFCLRAVEHELTRLGAMGRSTAAQRLIGRLRADLEFRDVHELLQEDVHGFLSRVHDGVNVVAESVAGQFFRLGANLQLYAVGEASL